LRRAEASPLRGARLASLSLRDNDNDNENENENDIDNDNNNDYGTGWVSPPPLPPKERPPLPPKLRGARRLSDASLGDTTYANLTPFYARPEDGDFLYAAGLDAPPHLPPKEARSPASASSSLSTAATQTLSMCDAETQTHEDDFYVLYRDDEDDGSGWDASPFERSVDGVLLTEEFRAAPPESPRPTAWTVSPRPRPHLHAPAHRLYPGPFEQGEARRRPRRDDIRASAPPASRPRSPGTREAFPADKIGWSVSQLRSLFNQSESSAADGVYRADGTPRRPSRLSDASAYSDDPSDEESYV